MEVLTAVPSLLALAKIHAVLTKRCTGALVGCAGKVAAEKAGVELVDPRPYFKGSMIKVAHKYRSLGKTIPAMGYSPQQVLRVLQSVCHAYFVPVALKTIPAMGCSEQLVLTLPLCFSQAFCLVVSVACKDAGIMLH